MRKEKDKINAIILEVTNLLLELGGKDICIHEEEKEDKYIIKMSISHTDINNDIIEKLNKTLNSDNVGEVEGYYWELLGKGRSRDNLYIIGSLIDKAEIRYLNDDELEIIMHREKR